MKQTIRALALLCAFGPGTAAATSLEIPFLGGADPTTGSTGTSTPIPVEGPSLGLNTIVSLSGPDAGRVGWFAGDYAPAGFAFAEGQALAPNSFPTLLDKIGATYGGDGVNTFELPDLRGRTIIGASETRPAGTLDGATTVTLTQDNLPEHTHTLPSGTTGPAGQANPTGVAVRQPSMALPFQISTSGVFPSRSDTASPNDSPLSSNDLTGIVRPTIDPDPGPQLANGDLLSIADNSALFSILGNRYGGDLPTSLGVPDLRDRTPIGAGSGPGLSEVELGQTVGSETTVLTTAICLLTATRSRAIAPAAPATAAICRSANLRSGCGSLSLSSASSLLARIRPCQKTLI